MNSADPRLVEAIEEAVAAGMAAHHLDPNWSDADRHSRCVCGGWVDGEMEIGWDDHMAAVAVAVLVNDGLLLVEAVPFEEFEVQTPGLRYPVPDMAAAWIAYGKQRAAGREAKIVTRTTLLGPWREVSA